MSPRYLRSLTPILLALIGAVPLAAQQLYFDVNGSTPGFGIVDSGVYNWNTSNDFWSTSAAGDVATGSWINDGTIQAVFAHETYVVQLDFDPQVRVLQALASGSGGGSALTLESNTATLREITLVDDIVEVGSRMTLLFGDFVTIANSSFTIESNGNAGIFGVGFVGLGPVYEGTITIQNQGRLTLTGEERTNQNTHIVLNGNGRLGGGSGMVGSLSGDGGTLVGVGSFEAEIVINQSIDTVWGGSTAEDRHSIIKQGEGRLTINGTVQNRQRLEVQEGALYLNGLVLRVNNAGAMAGSDRLDLFNSAELGGTADFQLGSLGGRVVTVLAPSESTGPDGHNAGLVAPGNPGEAGTLTLGAGFRATDGANFHFRMNGLDDSEALHNSHLLVEEIWDVGGDLILYFEDLGQGEIQAGTPYRIISAPGITTAENWLLVDDSLPTNWTVGDTPFTVVDDELYITFSQIPEPATIASLLGLGLLWMGWQRRRKS